MTPESFQLLIVAAMFPLGIVVFTRMLIRIRSNGGRVLTEGFGLPDQFMGFFLASFFAAMLFGSEGPDPAGVARTISAKDVVAGAAVHFVLVSVIFGFLAIRRISPLKQFGLRRMPVWRAGVIGVVLVLAAFPFLLVVSAATQALMGNQAHEQDVVTYFREAAGANQTSSVIALFVMAVVVAPVAEETIFRGYLYGVFKGWAGALPSVVFTSTLFAAVHNSLSAFPSLLALAVALTVAYEWSGSLLLPMAMHSMFNATQLAFLLASPNQPAAP